MFHFAQSLFARPPAVPALPAQRELDETLRDYGVLAAGLAAVLSRCPANLVKLHFQASAAALHLLRRQFRSALRKVQLPAAMLNDLAHEIAQCADAETRAAALRCLQRAVAARRAHPGAVQLAASH